MADWKFGYGKRLWLFYLLVQKANMLYVITIKIKERLFLFSYYVILIEGVCFF